MRTLLPVWTSLLVALWGCGDTASKPAAEDGQEEPAGEDGGENDGGDDESDGGDGESDGADGESDGGDGESDGGDGESDGGDGGEEEDFPENAWYQADPSALPDDLSGSSLTTGEVVRDLQMVDQNGDRVSLYQFYGRTVVLDISASWCGPCHELAPYLGDFADDSGDDGAIVVTVMLEGPSGSPGTADDVSAWVGSHGSHGPVVYLEDAGDRRAVSDAVTAFPSLMVVDTELRLVVPSLFDVIPSWTRGLEALGLSAGAALSAPEVCDDGRDDDADFLGDCADDDCADDPACTPSAPLAGSLGSCGWEESFDFWQVEVAGQVVEITVDNNSAAGAFEPIAYVRPAGSTDWTTTAVLADDEIPCTYPVPTYACGQSWLAPGSWEVIVTSGFGTDGDGDCADPDRADYALSFRGAATATLTAEDQPLPW